MALKNSDRKKVQHIHHTTVQKKPVSVKPLIIGTSVIVAIAIIVFSPCLTGEFLSWDDYNYIRDNPLIRVFSLDNIIHVFNYKTIVVGNYHPLTILSYMIEYQIAGLNPFLYHFNNLLLHLFNIVLVSHLMWLLTKKKYATLIATALFAVHPMRVESVVWAAERKDVLYTFFFLLSLMFYIYFLVKAGRNKQYYLISIFFFILSILSKGQAVVLPLTLFLVDYWYDRKITLNSVLNKIPYLFFSLMSGILAIVAQHSSLTEQRLLVHSFLERLSIAAFNLTAYLYKLVYPFNLSCFYRYPTADEMFWVYGGALIAIALIIVTAVFFRKNKPVVFGSLFFLFTISIVTQILPVGNAIIADRYTYIPYFGLFFIAGVLLDNQLVSKHGKPKLVIVLVIAVLSVFSVKTYLQARTWHDNETLWKHALSQDPKNAVACTNLGHYYIDTEDYTLAIDLLKKAIQNEGVYSEIYNAYQNLGVAYGKIGKDEEAVRCFSTAFSRKPGYIDAVFSRGLAYTNLSKYDSAIADFTTIISKIDSLNTKSYYSRGVAFNKANMPDRAIADYTTAIRIDPGYDGAYVNRGNIYFFRNSFDAAIDDYNIALRINPGDAKTFLNRSFAYFKKHRYKEALNDALKAKELKMEVHPRYISDLENAIRHLSTVPE